MHNRRCVSGDNYRLFCQSKGIGAKGAAKLRKAFIQYSTWLMEFQKKATSIGDNEVRFVWWW